MALLARVGPDASYLADVLVPVTLLGIGLTLTVTPLTATVLDSAAPLLADPLPTFVLGNEVVDALPFHVIESGRGGVTYAPDGGFFEGDNGGTAFTHGMQIGVVQGGSGNLQRDTQQLVQNFARFGYALIALDVAGHMAHNLFHLLAEGKGILFTALWDDGLTLWDIGGGGAGGQGGQPNLNCGNMMIDEGEGDA